MPFSVRLDPETERLIARLAREGGFSRSHVIREAVARYGAERSAGSTAYERMKSAIGMVSSGGRQLSTNSGEKVRAILEAKRRGQGSGRHGAAGRRARSK